MHLWACREVDSVTPPLGDGELCPGGGRSVLQGLWGRRTWQTGPGGMGSPAQGVVGVSCRACGEAEPGTPAWGDGEFSPGDGRSFLQGLRGWTTGPTGLGGWGVQPRGWSERPAGPVMT